jgi:hypothetical protein
MPTPEKKRERAAQLYLMASDAYKRGNKKLAELLIARANQYADEAAAQADQQDASTPLEQGQ